VWAVHHAWGGDFEVVVEHLAESAGVHAAAAIGAGGLLRPREAI
jgi:hypothetical protein